MSNPNCIHCGGELPGFARVPETVARTSKDGVLLAQIREDCKHVGFDWPSNDPDRSGPPERVIHSGDAIRHAAWHRSKMLRMIDERDAEIARLRTTPETCEQRIAVETPQSRSLFDMADNLIREMRKQDMWGMRSEYDNWTLRITRNEPTPKNGNPQA